MKLLLKLPLTRGEILLEIFTAILPICCIISVLSTILISSRVRHKLVVQKPKILKIVKNVRKKWRRMGLEEDIVSASDSQVFFSFLQKQCLNSFKGEAGLERFLGICVEVSPVLGIFGQSLYLQLYLGDIQGGPKLCTVSRLSSHLPDIFTNQYSLSLCFCWALSPILITSKYQPDFWVRTLSLITPTTTTHLLPGESFVWLVDNNDRSCGALVGLILCVMTSPQYQDEWWECLKCEVWSVPHCPHCPTEYHQRNISPSDHSLFPLFLFLPLESTVRPAGLVMFNITRWTPGKAVSGWADVCVSYQSEYVWSVRSPPTPTPTDTNRPTVNVNTDIICSSRLSWCLC